MIKKFTHLLYPFSAFILAFLSHVFYFIWKMAQVSSQWAQSANTAVLPLYFKQQEYFLGFSYALSAAFTVYAFLKFLHNRRSCIPGVIGGLTLTGGLYAGGCFLLGCCGSPMLAVYLGFFGSSFLAFAKPLIAIVTVISVIIGWFWMEKKSKKCCDGTPECAESQISAPGDARSDETEDLK